MTKYIVLSLVAAIILGSIVVYQSGVMRGAGVTLDELELHDRQLQAREELLSTNKASSSDAHTEQELDDTEAGDTTEATITMVSRDASDQTMLVAGGCFWCVEADLEKLPGVIDVVSGYAGGSAPANTSITYQNYDDLGHREVVQVTYNPAQVSYGQVLEWAIRHMDPTDSEGSFYDRGVQYSPAVYFATPDEREDALRVIAALNELGVYEKPLALAIESKATFYPAEEYHQDYYKKNSLKYSYYRYRSGRDTFIESVWGEDANELLTSGPSILYVGDSTTSASEYDVSAWSTFTKPTDELLRSTLTDQQYYVTQQEGTERAFQNEYWDNHEEGIYVDVVSGEPLFSSLDKFDSGTGWPSFTKPIYVEAVTRHNDYKLLVPRIEIRSRFADSHLGHVFNDAPAELGGIRYCMNSASLRFVPKERLEAEGYGQFMHLFE